MENHEEEIEIGKYGKPILKKLGVDDKLKEDEDKIKRIIELYAKYVKRIREIIQKLERKIEKI